MAFDKVWHLIKYLPDIANKVFGEVYSKGSYLVTFALMLFPEQILMESVAFCLTKG